MSNTIFSHDNKAEKTRKFLKEEEEKQLISLCDLCTELTEIERLARIGANAEKAFKSGMVLGDGPYYDFDRIAENAEELEYWARNKEAEEQKKGGEAKE